MIKMTVNQRKIIAGMANDAYSKAGWFGTMDRANVFKKAIEQNNKHISAALDFIPLTGVVTRKNYQSFITEVKKAFPLGGDGIAVITRLLALKRPDYFVCLDSKNQNQLSEDFGISKIYKDYDRYWDDIVCRIKDSIWWKSDKPIQKNSNLIWSESCTFRCNILLALARIGRYKCKAMRNMSYVSFGVLRYANTPYIIDW